jgi:hypothetical protein
MNRTVGLVAKGAVQYFSQTGEPVALPQQLGND